MILSIVVYVLFAALIVWGGKFAGFRDTEFYEDSFSLDVTKSLRGIAAFGIILHHIAQNELFQQTETLFLFRDAGVLFVSIFFFCSGFGLIKSMQSKPGYFNGFIKKRIVKTLVIPFYISVALYAVFWLAIGQKFEPLEWVCNLTGISLINEYAWYPVTAAILYLMFCLLFKKGTHQKLSYILMALFILALGVLFCFRGHSVWWMGERTQWWQQDKMFWFSGEWWVNTCPAFFIGMIFGRYETNIRTWFMRGYWFKLIPLLVLTVYAAGVNAAGQTAFGYWSEYMRPGPGITDKLLTYLCQIPYCMLFCVSIFVVMFKYHSVNPVTRFFGNMSLETYLMNYMAIVGCSIILLRQHTELYRALYTAAVVAATILLGLLFKFLCNCAMHKKTLH